jgi:hypothetical protein
MKRDLESEARPKGPERRIPVEKLHPLTRALLAKRKAQQGPQQAHQGTEGQGGTGTATTGKDRCVACQGTGISSRGWQCYPCRGKGFYQ